MRVTLLMPLLACFAFVFNPVAFGQGAASCNVTQIQIEIGIGALRGLVGGTDSLGVQVHFTDGTAETWQNISQGASWPANSAHTTVIQLSSARPLNNFKSTLFFDVAPVGSRPWNMAFLKITAIGNGASAPIGTYGSFNFLVTGNVVVVHPPPGEACSPNSNRVAGSIRPLTGAPVESPTSPINEKAAQRTLLAPGAQKALLGAQPNSPQPGNGTLTLNGGNQANSSPTGGTLAVNSSPQQGSSVGGSLAVNGSPQQGSSRGGGALAVNGAPQQSVSGQTMSAQGNAGSNAGPAPIPSKGQGRTEYEPMTVERGVTQDKAFANWANSGHAPVAIQENPNVYVAQACAKEPSFRILLVSGVPDGKTLTVGPQYTIWGCSFGNIPAVKRPAPPVTSRSQNQTGAYPSYYNVSVWTSQPFIDIDARTVSWSDNSIVVTFPNRPANHPGPSTADAVLPSQLLVTRGDGQTRIYGSAGGLYFRLTN